MNDLQKYIDKALESISFEFDKAIATDEDYDINSEICDLISRTRSELGLTQKELSAISGMTQANISKIENGGAHPSISTLKKLADSMGKRLIIDFVEKEGMD